MVLLSFVYPVKQFLTGYGRQTRRLCALIRLWLTGWQQRRYDRRERCSRTVQRGETVFLFASQHWVRWPICSRYPDTETDRAGSRNMQWTGEKGYAAVIVNASELNVNWRKPVDDERFYLERNDNLFTMNWLPGTIIYDDHFTCCCLVYVARKSNFLTTATGDYNKLRINYLSFISDCMVCCFGRVMVDETANKMAFIWTVVCWQSDEFISPIGYLTLGIVEVVVDSVLLGITWSSELQREVDK